MIISEHARRKWRGITKAAKDRGDSVIDYEIREAFSEVKEEQMTPGLVRRIMNNDFGDTTYYRKGDIRFVVCKNPSGESCLRTVELNTFAKETQRRFSKKLYSKRHSKWFQQVKRKGEGGR